MRSDSEVFSSVEKWIPSYVIHDLVLELAVALLLNLKFRIVQHLGAWRIHSDVQGVAICFCACVTVWLLAGDQSSLLLQEWGLFLIDQINVLIFHHLKQVVIESSTLRHGSVNFLGVLRSKFTLQPFDDLGSDAVDNLQKWSLSQNPSQVSSGFDIALFDILIQNLFIELRRRRGSQVIW